MKMRTNVSGHGRSHSPLKSESTGIITAWGFTLIDLIVTIAVIAILLALLLPALAYASFRSKVTVCSSNFRQLCVATSLYAGDDSRGRLPAYRLPVESSALAGYRTLEPWFLPMPMIMGMAEHGMVPKLWYCPTRSGWRDINGAFQSLNNGRSIVTSQDLYKSFAIDQRAVIFPPDLCWWVPRPLGESGMVYPDPTLCRTRVPTQWPKSTADASANILPIASDWNVAGWDNSGMTLKVIFGGHRFDGRIRSCSVAYLDGRVETKPSKQLNWQIIGPYDHAVVY